MMRGGLVTPVLLAGAIILLVSFGIRSTFGLFQIPIADEFGWMRSEFSLAIAIQNLAWGIGQPVFGAIAEKLGERRAILLGALFYAAGLTLSSFAVTPGAHQALNILIGFGIAGTSFGVILAIVGRAASAENRSMALALATAIGSGGQILAPPVAEWLLTFLAWPTVFLILAATVLASLALLPLLRAPKGQASVAEAAEPLAHVLGRALRDPSYILIFLGFFACGYQLAFISAHFPALVVDLCGPIAPGDMLANMGITTPTALGALAIAVIGVANVGGTLLAGWAGKRWPKKSLLAGVYAARTVIGAWFILNPITPVSVLVFAAVMGTLWLATVPLTSGLVAQLFGLRYMGTLYGLVFFSHQLGGFVGVWLGGRLYDATGSYTAVWWLGVAVGALSALMHLGIRESRGQPAAA